MSLFLDRDRSLSLSPLKTEIASIARRGTSTSSPLLLPFPLVTDSSSVVQWIFLSPAQSISLSRSLCFSFSLPLSPTIALSPAITLLSFSYFPFVLPPFPSLSLFLSPLFLLLLLLSPPTSSSSSPHMCVCKGEEENLFFLLLLFPRSFSSQSLLSLTCACKGKEREILLLPFSLP